MEENPNLLTNRCLEKILYQMKNFLYKVNEKKGKFDTGFFCYIKNHNKYIPTLLINNYIKVKENQNTINISLNNKPTTIELGDTIYRNKKYNMTMMEIKEDNIDKINFFKLDDFIYEKDSEMYFMNKQIYIINWDNKI